MRVNGALGMLGVEAMGQPCWGVWAKSSLRLGPLGGQLASVTGPQWMAV